MSFIVPAPTPTEEEASIVSGPFWPDIDPAKMREAQRIDNTVTAPRLRHALIEAIATANGALRSWRQGRMDAGYNTLEEIEAEEIDGVSIHVHRYQRAVGCLAKALLLERLKDFDSTAKGDRKAEALEDPIDDLRRDYLNALADITGKGRCTVELI